MPLVLACISQNEHGMWPLTVLFRKHADAQRDIQYFAAVMYVPYQRTVQIAALRETGAPAWQIESTMSGAARRWVVVGEPMTQRAPTVVLSLGTGDWRLPGYGSISQLHGLGSSMLVYCVDSTDTPLQNAGTVTPAHFTSIHGMFLTRHPRSVSTKLAWVTQNPAMATSVCVQGCCGSGGPPPMLAALRPFRGTIYVYGNFTIQAAYIYTCSCGLNPCRYKLPDQLQPPPRPVAVMRPHAEPGLQERRVLQAGRMLHAAGGDVMSACAMLHAADGDMDVIDVLYPM